ncbi:MAG: type II toxin-antitoxin system HigB family toxin [SAR324 cluster bacterium]|nr:type II toxin-antitoxin system HigB family toxin [SAR324 cluster bacterium]
MHIISYKKIREFCERHSKAETSLNHWYRIIRHEEFKNFADIKRVFSSADQVENFVVFNIGGNNYRLIAFVRYQLKRLFIRHILTHSEYDKEKWKEDIWFQNSNN